MFIAFTWLDFVIFLTNFFLLLGKEGFVQEWCRWMIHSSATLTEGHSPVELWQSLRSASLPLWRSSRLLIKNKRGRKKDSADGRNFQLSRLIHDISVSVRVGRTNKRKKVSKSIPQKKKNTKRRARKRTRSEAKTWNVTKLINSFDIEFISRSRLSSLPRLFSLPFIDDKEF